MNEFYFTYGSDGTQPFVGGWTVVEAPSFNEAVDTFRAAHPDRNDGFINCAGMYFGEKFKEKPMFKNGNFGKFEVERLVYKGEET